MNRQSPAHHLLLKQPLPWGTIHGMPLPLSAPALPATFIVDLSALPRRLVRGARAAAWLAAHGIAVPERYFGCRELDGGAFIARTGAREFLLVDGPEGRTTAALPEEADGVLALPRDDQELALGGAALRDVLLQTCSFDFTKAGPDDIVYANMIGVGCWLRPGGGRIPYLRIGCDPSYGEYLFETLLGIVAEAGGGVIGFKDFWALRQSA
ncbi:MAG TPA: hypothetical protein VNN09_00135 [Candidatus Competibacteraceae bacterium]|nr:hypothetical protein [Candidatus Competibacteraceae bacterium]